VVRGSFDFPPMIFVGVNIGSAVVGLVWVLMGMDKNFCLVVEDIKVIIAKVFVG